MPKTNEMELADKECVPCKGGTPPLGKDQIQELSRQLSQGWKVIDNHHLEKQFKFEDFRQALDFTNEVGELAESVDHHPDIYLAWGEVKLTLWTHSIDGLTESDFVFAAKVDKLRQQAEQRKLEFQTRQPIASWRTVADCHAFTR